MIGIGEGTLVINPGSSSIKFSLYFNEEELLRGIVDGIGTKAKINVNYKESLILSEFREVPDSFVACSIILHEVEKVPIKIKKIVYRIVHGGELKKHSVIDRKIFHYLNTISNLAPIHIPNTLNIIDFFKTHINAKNIALFDTVFHKDMPQHSVLYAIPTHLSKKYKIKRYGFHGLAHEYMWLKAKKYNKSFSKVITCQLGNGVSMTAIKDGKSIDTSMGFTPLEGLVMGTRSGNIDPGLIEFLCKKENKSVEEITKMLQNESGLKGLCGEWDMRKVVSAKNGKLALDIFAYAFKKQLGAYVAVLNGVDAIIIGGGIAKSIEARKALFSNLDYLGIELDGEKVAKKPDVCLSKGKIPIYAVESDEQQIMFNLSKRF